MTNLFLATLHRCLRRRRGGVGTSVLLIGVLLGGAALAPAASSAQQEDKPATPPSSPASAAPVSAAPVSAAEREAQAVLIQINDVGLMRALIPLKLTRDQRDTLLAVTRALAAEGEKRRRQDADALRALAPEIRRSYEIGLRGEDIPAEIDERAGKVFKEIETRLAAARRNAIGRLLIVLKEDLTPTQKAHIEKESVRVFGGTRVPKEYARDPSKAPKEVIQDLALAAYAERVLLNERAAEVLSRLKPSDDAAASPTATTP